jgi:hypothetical protein
MRHTATVSAMPRCLYTIRDDRWPATAGSSRSCCFADGWRDATRFKQIIEATNTFSPWADVARRLLNNARCCWSRNVALTNGERCRTKPKILPTRKSNEDQRGGEKGGGWLRAIPNEGKRGEWSGSGCLPCVSSPFRATAPHATIK